MIKTASLILAATGALALAACSSSKPAPSYQGSTQPAPVMYGSK